MHLGRVSFSLKLSPRKWAFAEGNQVMWDLGMSALGVAFFAIAIFYVKGCNLLAKKEAAK